MTEKKNKTRKITARGALLLLSLLLLAIFLIFARSAADYARRALTLVATALVPSLFPFMVISELLVGSGVGESLGRLFARPMRWLFGLSGAGCSAVFLGSLCGFPIGAKTAVSLYDKNIISKVEIEHLLTFSNNPSSAFLISAVGISLFSSRKLGVLMYATVLTCGFAVGIASRFFMRVKDSTEQHRHFPTGIRSGGIEIFTGAVSHASSGMLLVCAYVILFSSLTGALTCMLEEVGELPVIIKAVLFGILEISGGVSAAAGLDGIYSAVVLATAIAGWSGLSVHFQIMTLCGGRGISFRPYIIAKLFQGLLCAVVMGILLRVIPSEWILSASDTYLETALFSLTGALEGFTIPTVISNAVFILGWLGMALKRQS
jgi:sporulation integral membrane protein YlbJ